jgi:hypothetical protein
MEIKKQKQDSEPNQNTDKKNQEKQYENRENN